MVGKVTIKRMVNKVKIIIEYSIRLGLPFANIVPERDGVIVKVFLKNSGSISSDEIKSFSITAKPVKEKT